MTYVRLGVPTLVAIVAIVGAAAFAAGRSTVPTATASTSPEPAVATVSPHVEDDPIGMGGQALPPGHPAIDPTAPAAPATSAESALSWKAPPRWQVAPNTSSMRIATYRIPRAPGDPADAELSVVQAGGTVDANVDRWIGQFDAAGQKTAKRSTRKIAGLDVTIVEARGTFASGMGGDQGALEHWGLLGAIVATPGSPHFFKLIGPEKSVFAARAELDALLATLSER